MTYEEFNASLAQPAPPALPATLVALWHDAHGNWDEAHRVAQDVDDASGAWVHAYLHRKATSATRATGTGAPAGQLRAGLSRTSGKTSSGRCWCLAHESRSPWWIEKSGVN